MRDTKTRKADVLATLERQGDIWLATADSTGRPHLIPVSAWWDGTAMIDADVIESSAVEDSAEVADCFFRLRPTRIQAHRGYDELEGREIMRDARWLA